MTLPLTVTFTLANWIVKGLVDGSLTRIGGVIVNSTTKQIVTWLRDNHSLAPMSFSIIHSNSNFILTSIPLRLCASA